MPINQSEMIIRAAKASMHAGGHIPEPPNREKFAMQAMQTSLGTITAAEIDELYADEQRTWAAIKSLPGVELMDHGCAYMPAYAGARKGNPHDGPDLHAADAADPSIPDTVADLLSMANANTGPVPVFEMTIFPLPREGEETAYAQEIAFLEGAPPVYQVVAMLRGAADALEQRATNDGH